LLIASRISRIRSRQLLGDIHQLSHHLFSQARLQ
jgi:hypothetical protein